MQCDDDQADGYIGNARGYVALAVDGPNGTVTAEVETGHGNREHNMVEFAVAALKLLKQAIEDKARI